MATRLRLGWIDIIKGICMFLIILSHTFCPEIYTRFYTPVFLTAFFFVSGYTFGVKANFKSFFLAKCRALLVPMFFFGIFEITVACVFNNADPIARTIGILLQRSCHMDSFWFLGCLFTTLMLFYIIVRLTKDNALYIFIASVMLCVSGYLYIGFINIKLPWQVECAMVMEIWLALGYIYKKYENALENCIDIKNFCLVTIIYIAVILAYNNEVNIRLQSYNNICVFMVSSFVGIIMLVMLSKLIKNNVVMQYIGFNSLIFYALQSKAIKVWMFVFDKLGIMMNEYISTVIIAVLACVLIAPCAYIINRWFPFVLGKKIKSAD